MKKTLLYTLCSLALATNALPALGQYQVQNSGFELWENVSYNLITGEEPENWNSFVSGTGTLKNTACKVSQVQSSDDVRPGSIGLKSAKIMDYDVKLGLIHVAYAQGNMTTGCINMGSMTAADCGNESKKGNCNYTDSSKDGLHQKFTGLPDTMRVWVKFYSTNSNFRAKATTVLHTEGYFQDPNNGDCSAQDVATAIDKAISPTNQWQELKIPFEYNLTDGTKPSYALVSFSTNVTPGTGTGNDYMLIDDLEYIYSHSLTSCKYNGQNVTFNEKNEAVVNDIYEASKFTYEKKGVGATVEESYDETTGKLTITVKGNDYEVNEESVTTYTIQFAKPEEVKFAKVYTEDLYVFINGQILADSQPTPVTVQTRYDGKINFLLKNFALEGMYIGNINVDGLEVEDGKFSCQDKSIEITAGDLEGVEEGDWWGPALSEADVKANMEGRFVGDNNIKASLSILFGDMNINVHLGYTPTKANMTVGANKYGTFYAPFAVTLPGDVKAYTCGSLNNGSTLVLTSVDGGEIPANTAVIVESANGTSQDFYNFEEGLKVEDGNTGLLYGVATGEKTAPAGSYVLQSQENNVQKFYRVAGENLMIPANRCYLQLPASSGVKAISFPSDPTAVDGVKELLSGKAEIYDLEGRRLPALQKGINIVGGKKVMVK